MSRYHLAPPGPEPIKPQPCIPINEPDHEPFPLVRRKQ